MNRNFSKEFVSVGFKVGAVTAVHDEKHLLFHDVV